MSGARGFHHSDSDHKRSFAGSRAFTYESGRGGMSDILTHTNVETRAPMARSGAGMASILDHATPSENAKPQFSSSMLPSNASQYTSAGMMDVMRGVGQMGVDDALHGLGRRTLNQKHSGAGALAALRGEEAEAGMDDPFAHTRGGARAKLHPRDAGMEVALPNMGIPGTLDAATRDVMAARAAGAPSKRGGPDEPISAQLRNIHNELNQLAFSLEREAAPEDPRMGVLGRLKDYHPLLDLLTSRNIRLNADAAGTLIATVDVEGGISFEDFMECVAMSFKGSEKPPPPEGHAQPQEAVAPAPAPVRGVVKGLGAPMLPLDAARSTYRMPEPTTASSDTLLVKRPTFDPTKLDVRNMLGKGGTAGAATNDNIAQLLNGGFTHDYGRKSEAEFKVTRGPRR